MASTPSFPEFPPTSGRLARWCAERWGDHPFVVIGDRRMTYAEADARSIALAKGLLVAGVGKGTHLGLLAANGPEWVVAWLAATRVGGVLALLNTYSTARELRRALRHGDVAHLLTVDSHLRHDYLGRLEAVAPELAHQRHGHLLLEELPYLRTVWTWPGDAGRSSWGATGEGVDRSWCGPLDELVERGAHVSDSLLAEVEREVTPADPMMMVFSSGSTADPKAIVHSHGATVRHAHNLNQIRGLGHDDVIYTPMPLFWVGGLSFSLIAAMHAGATIVFEDVVEPAATLALLERERVTQVLGWPHMGKLLADHPDYVTRDLSSLRPGAATALPPPAPGEEPRATSLGMSETLGPHTLTDHTPLPPQRVGSFGLAVPGVEHRVVDPVTLTDVEPGTIGEIWVRGYSVMLGLHKRERADVFTPDGWYRTGDTGRFDVDGHLYFTGRMGDVIKASGMNVTPREVETVLEEMPEVAMALVVGVDHPDRGQDIVAAIALQPGAALDADTARVRAKDELASYKVPRHIVVYASQAELPQLDSGKIDRRTIAAWLGREYLAALAAQAPHEEEPS
jgi:acyl-CoA synthetase (AMP-forming)/AMP-acid ligase II